VLCALLTEKIAFGDLSHQHLYDNGELQDLRDGKQCAQMVQMSCFNSNRSSEAKSRVLWSFTKSLLKRNKSFTVIQLNGLDTSLVEIEASQFVRGCRLFLEFCFGQ